MSKFVVSNYGPIPPSMRQDMADIYRMRREGPSYAAFELLWSLIHIDDLVLDTENGKKGPSVTDARVTQKYWSKFGQDMFNALRMLPYAIWGTRWVKIYAKDDPVRAEKYGPNAHHYPKVEVPYVVPYMAVNVAFEQDESFQTIVIPLDDHGNARKDLFVTYAQNGCVNMATHTFESECGALLREWRHYNSMMELHDKVANRTTNVMPYVEHVPITEQSRGNDEARAAEELLHDAVEMDENGFDKPKEKLLRKIDRPMDPKLQPFIELPPDRRLCATQVLPTTSFDIDAIHKRWLSQLASTLQIPLRHLQTEEKSGLGSNGNEATVEDDTERAVRVASSYRNELVEVMSEAYLKIYGKRPTSMHLPTATHMKPALIFQLWDRGHIDSDTANDELSLKLGMKRKRFTTPPPPALDEFGRVLPSLHR